MTVLACFLVIASFCATSYGQIIRTYTYIPTTTTTTTSATALPQCEYESCRHTIEDLVALIKILKSLSNNNSSKNELTEDIILKLINALVYTSTYNHKNTLGHYPGIHGLLPGKGIGGSSGVDPGYVGKPGSSGKGNIGPTNIKGVDPVPASAGVKPVKTTSSIGTSDLDSVASKDTDSLQDSKNDKSPENVVVPGILSDSNKTKQSGTKNVDNKDKSGGSSNTSSARNVSVVGKRGDNTGGVGNADGLGNASGVGNAAGLGNKGGVGNTDGIVNSSGVDNAGSVGNNSRIVNTGSNVATGGKNNGDSKASPGVINNQGGGVNNNGNASNGSDKKPNNSLIDVGLKKKNDLDVAGKKILDVNAGKN